jgi:phage terminase large subunit-like protein
MAHGRVARAARSKPPAPRRRRKREPDHVAELRRTIPERWQKLFALIPDYDPIATAEPGDWFDVQEADETIAFFAECLQHIEGDCAGKPFILERFQQAIIGCIFGWRRKDDRGRIVRRYREVFLLLPRKNGKTPLAAGIVLCCLCRDEEPGAQIYGAAKAKMQAALLFRQASLMVQREPELHKHLRIYRALQAIVRRDDEGTAYRPVSAEAGVQHGQNAHVIVIDELHAFNSRELIDTLATGQASEGRKQALLIFLTTADYERVSVCNERHDYARKVCRGSAKDSRFFPVLYEADKKEDWTDPKLWARVNPNLGVSVSKSYLEREAQKALDMPALANAFRRFHLNIRTENASPWVTMDVWDRGRGAPENEPPPAEQWPIDPEAFAALVADRPCYAGLDLSSYNDLCALALVWPGEEATRPPTEDATKGKPQASNFKPQAATPWYCRLWFWGTRRRALERARISDQTPYLLWSDRKLITLCEDDSVDYGLIRNTVNALHSYYIIRQIAVDKAWQGLQVMKDLANDGMTVVEHYQSAMHMAAPVKAFAELLSGGRFIHGGNPVLRWHAGNVITETDSHGNIRFSKKKSADKIDGMLAATMAISMAMKDPSGGRTAYDDGGLFILGS